MSSSVNPAMDGFFNRRVKIYIYNLYTDQWMRNTILEDANIPPLFMSRCCGVSIDTDVYLYGVTVRKDHLSSMWKLKRDRRGCFSWSKVDVNEEPSYRYYTTGWEYAAKVWIFGGVGIMPTVDGHLNDLENFRFAFSDDGFDCGHNNQLLSFDPSCHEWTNIKSVGSVPSHQQEYSSTMYNNKVWIHAGFCYRADLSCDLFELNMCNLTWTQIQMSEALFDLYSGCSISAITESKLIFHGKTGVTWILDLSSLSWKKYEGGQDHQRFLHSSMIGLNSSVVITGGYVDYPQHVHKCTYTIRLEPNSLKQLATKTIYESRATLPWKDLPKKLIQKIMGTAPEEDVEDTCAQ